MTARMIRTALLLVRDLLHFAALTCSSHTSLAAENLFLGKQRAFYIERTVRPRRLDDAARIALVMLARVIDWRQLLTVGPTRYARPVAPSELPPVLAQDVAAPWPSSDSPVPPGPDRHHGASESNLG
jgi:hypothetical protein